MEQEFNDFIALKSINDFSRHLRMSSRFRPGRLWPDLFVAFLQDLVNLVFHHIQDVGAPIKMFESSDLHLITLYGISIIRPQL